MTCLCIYVTMFKLLILLLKIIIKVNIYIRILSCNFSSAVGDIMIKTNYDELFTYQSLYQAHLRGRRCKRDKKPLVRFEMITLDHLHILYDKIRTEKYKPSKYSTFTVRIPKIREIQTQPYENRVVQHVLCDNLLTPYFEKRAILDNAACQKGKGMHYALDRFERMLQAHVKKHGVTGYFLKCDILKYFPSIPHKRLKQVICSHIEDERIKKLIESIIDSYHTKAAFLKKYDIPYSGKGDITGRGIPIGNQTSQIFGMFYLNKVDRLIKEQLRIKVYSRYMDDFVLLHEDKEYVKNALEEIKKAVKYLGLLLNAKTQIIPIKNGITYLGFRFVITSTGKVVRMVKKETKKRLRGRAKLLKKAYLDGIIPLERVEASLAAFHGHLHKGDNYRFEEELKNKLTFTNEE